MNEINKIWKKRTVRKISKDYTVDPPTIKEWVEFISEYDEEKDNLEENEFDEHGKLIRTILTYENKIRFIEYNEDGFVIKNEITEIVENAHGDQGEMTEDDLGNRSEEKLEYDEKGRCTRKIFLENGVEISWLEFEYDNRDRVIKTKEFVGGRLEFYEEDIYVSEGESISLRYNSLGQLTLRTEYKKLNDRNTYINSYYDDEGNLIRRNEEDRNNDDEVLEQRIYDGDDNLTYQIVFSENDEFGFRKRLVDYEYMGRQKVKEIVTSFDYKYSDK